MLEVGLTGQRSVAIRPSKVAEIGGTYRLATSEAIPCCYSAPDRGAEYCDERVFVCVFVCPRSYLRNYTSDFHQIIYACYLWPWLGPLAA